MPSGWSSGTGCSAFCFVPMHFSVSCCNTEPGVVRQWTGENVMDMTATKPQGQQGLLPQKELKLWTTTPDRQMQRRRPQLQIPQSTQFSWFLESQEVALWSARRMRHCLSVLLHLLALQYLLDCGRLSPSSDPLVHTSSAGWT